MSIRVGRRAVEKPDLLVVDRGQPHEEAGLGGRAPEQAGPCGRVLLFRQKSGFGGGIVCHGCGSGNFCEM